MRSKDRKVLEEIMGVSLKAELDKAKHIGFSGRLWGVNGSKYMGSHVSLGTEDEFVSIYINYDGEVQVLEFKMTISRTALGNEVRKILKKAGLTITQ